MLRDPLRDQVDFLQRELMRQRKRIEGHSAKLEEIVTSLNAVQEFLHGQTRTLNEKGFVAEKATFEAKPVEDGGETNGNQ